MEYTSSNSDAAAIAALTSQAESLTQLYQQSVQEIHALEDKLKTADELLDQLMQAYEDVYQNNLRLSAQLKNPQLPAPVGVTEQTRQAVRQILDEAEKESSRLIREAEDLRNEASKLYHEAFVQAQHSRRGLAEQTINAQRALGPGTSVQVRPVRVLPAHSQNPARELERGTDITGMKPSKE